MDSPTQDRFHHRSFLFRKRSDSNDREREKWLRDQKDKPASLIIKKHVRPRFTKIATSDSLTNGVHPS